MPDESDKSSITNKCELFVVEVASFERFSNNTSSDSAPKSLIFRAGSPVDRAESLEQLKEFVENLGKSEEDVMKEKENLKQGYFMGFLTCKQAEKEVLIPGQFATYYRINNKVLSQKPPKDSNISLDLHICYLNTHHQHKHYPIIKKVQQNYPRIFFQLAHFDSSRPSNEPIFTSIKYLLKHYTQFVYVDSISKSGEIRVEVFPK